MPLPLLPTLEGKQKVSTYKNTDSHAHTCMHLVDLSIENDGETGLEIVCRHRSHLEGRECTSATSWAQAHGLWEYGLAPKISIIVWGWL